MASFTALRTSRRPLSLLATHKPSVSSISNSGSSSGSVRWASIVPYTITATGPPAPPMTLEQVALLQQRKQQTLLEEQIQLEKSQRARQQLELRQQLARHRNRILEQQREEQQKAAAGVETGAKEKEGTQRVGEEQRQPTRESRRGPRSTRQDGEVTEAAEASHASMFVGTRRRSMFGYRGPEHSTLGAEAQEEGEEETRYAEVAAQSQRRVLVTAEDRVQLAMMDYSPREIDAMSPEQVQKILSSTSRASESVEEEEQDLDKVHTFDDVISPPTLPPTASTSSVELELDSCLAKSTSSST
ncbi:hypothetical protein BG005_007637 [Podila minutissima]|nr:hypothetical protein BG005_007637 [Podila minutissima]